MGEWAAHLHLIPLSAHPSVHSHITRRRDADRLLSVSTAATLTDAGALPNPITRFSVQRLLVTRSTTAGSRSSSGQESAKFILPTSGRYMGLLTESHHFGNRRNLSDVPATLPRCRIFAVGAFSSLEHSNATLGSQLQICDSEENTPTRCWFSGFHYFSSFAYPN